MTKYTFAALNKFSFTLVIKYETHKCTERYETAEAAQAELGKALQDMKKYGIKATGFVHKA